MTTNPEEVLLFTDRDSKNLLKIEELVGGGAWIGTPTFLVAKDQPVMPLPRCSGFEDPKQGDY